MTEHPVIWYTLWFLIGSVIAQLVMHYRKMARERKDNEQRGSQDDE